MSTDTIRAECRANHRCEHEGCAAGGGPAHEGGEDQHYVCEREPGHTGRHAWLRNAWQTDGGELVTWANLNRVHVTHCEARNRYGRCQRIAAHVGCHAGARDDNGAIQEWHTVARFATMTFGEAMAALVRTGEFADVGIAHGAMDALEDMNGAPIA